MFNCLRMELLLLEKDPSSCSCSCSCSGCSDRSSCWLFCLLSMKMTADNDGTGFNIHAYFLKCKTFAFASTEQVQIYYRKRTKLSHQFCQPGKRNKTLYYLMLKKCLSDVDSRILQRRRHGEKFGQP